MIKLMLAEHERFNTDFYNEMKKGETPILLFKDIYTKRNKYQISRNLALTKIAILIMEYLEKHRVILNDTKMASFLFEYFSYLKVFKVDDPKLLPSNHKELPNFYKSQGFHEEYMRTTIRDSKKHWGIN